MRYKKLGKTGIDVSAIGIGTWQMGNGSHWNANLNDRTSIDTIRTAVDHPKTPAFIPLTLIHWT